MILWATFWVAFWSRPYGRGMLLSKAALTQHKSMKNWIGGDAMVRTKADEPAPCSSPIACCSGWLLKLWFVIHRAFACAVQWHSRKAADLSLFSPFQRVGVIVLEWCWIQACCEGGLRLTSAEMSSGFLCATSWAVGQTWSSLGHTWLLRGWSPCALAGSFRNLNST